MHTYIHTCTSIAQQQKSLDNHEMNMEGMWEHPWFQCSYFLKFPMVHISPIQFNGQIHPPWTIVTFKKMNMEAMLEHAWLQCSCFLNFPMIQISPIHSNGQLHPPWRHTNQEDNYTLCWYVFKAGELNHWKIQKNMNTLLCSHMFWALKSCLSSIACWKRQKTYMGMAAMLEHQMTSMFISKLLSTKI